MAAVEDAKIEEDVRVVTTMELVDAALAALRKGGKRSAKFGASYCREKRAYLAEDAAATEALLAEAMAAAEALLAEA